MSPALPETNVQAAFGPGGQDTAPSPIPTASPSGEAADAGETGSEPTGTPTAGPAAAMLAPAPWPAWPVFPPPPLLPPAAPLPAAPPLLLPPFLPPVLQLPAAPAPVAPPPPAPTPPVGCAGVRSVCHVFVSAGAPQSALLVGPCPRPLMNCAEFTVTGSFTVSAVFTGLVPGTPMTLVIPVVTVSGQPAGTRSIACGAADATGTACCAGTVEGPVVPQAGGQVLLLLQPPSLTSTATATSTAGPTSTASPTPTTTATTTSTVVPTRTATATATSAASPTPGASPTPTSTATATPTSTATATPTATATATSSVPGRAYVANAGSNSVTVIDTTTNTVVGGPIAVGSPPSFVAIGP